MGLGVSLPPVHANSWDSWDLGCQEWRPMLAWLERRVGLLGMTEALFYRRTRIGILGQLGRGGIFPGKKSRLAILPLGTAVLILIRADSRTLADV